MCSSELRDVRDEFIDDISSNHIHIGFLTYGHKHRKQKVGLPRLVSLRPRIVLGMTKLNGVAISNLSLFVYNFPVKIMFSPFLAELTQDQPSLIP